MARDPRSWPGASADTPPPPPPAAVPPRGFFAALGDPELDPIRAGLAPAPPAGPPPPDPSSWPGAFAPTEPQMTMGERLKQGASDAVHGLLGLPGQLYDLAAVPQNLLASATGAEWLRAKPAQERVGQGLAAVGLPAEAGTGLTSDVIQSVAGALPVMGGANLALQGGRSLLANRPVARAVVGALADSPATQTIASAGAGVGQAAGEELFPESPVAQTLTSLLGGAVTGGVMTAGKAAVRSLSAHGDVTFEALHSLLKHASNKAAVLNDALGFTRAADTIDAPGGYGPPAPDAAAALRNLRTTGEVMGGTAELPGDPGLIVAEKTVRSRGGVPDQFMLNDIAREQGRGEITGAIAPGGDPAAIRAPIEARAAAAQARVDQAGQALGPAVPGTATGPVLQQAFTAERQASGAGVRAAADAVDPQAAAQIRTAPFKNVMRASAERLMPSGDDPTRWPSDVQDRLADLSQRHVGYNQLRNVTQALRETENANPGTQLAVWARDSINAIEERLQQPGTLPPDVAQAHADYLQAARDRGARFAGPIAQDLQGRDAGGRPTAEQSTIAGQFFKPDRAGGPDSIAAFQRYYTDPATGQLRPEAQAALGGHVANQVAAFTDPTTGVVNPRALAAWVGNHRETLRAAGLYDQVNNLANAQRLAERAGLAGFRGAADLGEYQGNVARTILGAENMPDAVHTILNNDNPVAAMRDTVRRLGGNRDAIEGLRRAVLDHWGAASEGSTPGVSGTPGVARSGAERWWDANRRTLDVLFSADELRRLQAVRDDLWSGNRARARTGVTGSDTQPNLSNAQAMAQLALGGGSASPIGQALGRAAQRLPFGVGDWIGDLARNRADRVLGRVYQLALEPDTFGAAVRRFSPEGLAQLQGLAERPPAWRRGLRGGAARGVAAALPALLGRPAPDITVHTGDR